MNKQDILNKLQSEKYNSEMELMRKVFVKMTEIEPLFDKFIYEYRIMTAEKEIAYAVDKLKRLKEIK